MRILACGSAWLLGILAAVGLSAMAAGASPAEQPDRLDSVIEYRLEPVANGGKDLTTRFSGFELALIEKLNRVDVMHMGRLDQLVIPTTWQGDDGGAGARVGRLRLRRATAVAFSDSGNVAAQAVTL